MAKFFSALTLRPFWLTHLAFGSTLRLCDSAFGWGTDIRRWQGAVIHHRGHRAHPAIQRHPFLGMLPPFFHEVSSNPGSLDFSLVSFHVRRHHWSVSFKRSTSLCQRAPSVTSPRVRRLSWVSRKFHVLVVIGSLISFIIAIGCGYLFLLPSFSQAFHDYDTSKFNGTFSSCNVFYGSWAQDDSYPLYNATECPFVEQGFNCLGNGRNNKDYLRWRWKPKTCDILRFNVRNILEKFRSKRVVFVGDSMSQTQWESLICLLMTGVENKKSVYEMNGNKITKQIRFLGVRFSSFNFTIEFFRSVFLVQQGWMPKHAPKRVKSTLKLDKLDNISTHWINSDVLIFNTGQWWVPGKLFET
ncbi:protein trichome berefringence-like 7 [Juglans regia]|uniref:Protein trichome berefringence-like 7 n=1 Tax=Juglans regia TaxID=51240 RepID=A0A2I4HSG1_JUGRE|nr:protein trichome berefringence-like 7 [Juglans regia]